MHGKPVYTFAQWQVKEGQLPNVLSLLAGVAEKSKREVGNLFYKIYQSQTDANTLLLYEGYQDDGALEAHRNSAHFRNIVVAEIVPLLQNRKVELITEILS